MSELFVRFPGTLGNFISTDDVNLLDADTAHLEQSIGEWVAKDTDVAAAVVDDPHGFAGKAVRLVQGFPTFDPGAWVGEWPNAFHVLPSTQYSWAADFKAEVATTADARVDARWYEADGTIIGWSGPTDMALTDTHFTRVWHTYTSPTNAAFVALVPAILDVALEAAFRVTNLILREGSDPTFVPSLRIVGDLDETIDPPDMPIAFPGDGTPLTIGEGWAGDAYSYIRRDGVGGPIVAQFDPADIVLP